MNQLQDLRQRAWLKKHTGNIKKHIRARREIQGQDHITSMHREDYNREAKLSW